MFYTVNRNVLFGVAGVYHEEHGVEIYLQQLKQNAAVSFVYSL